MIAHRKWLIRNPMDAMFIIKPITNPVYLNSESDSLDKKSLPPLPLSISSIVYTVYTRKGTEQQSYIFKRTSLSNLTSHKRTAVRFSDDLRSLGKLVWF